MIAVLLVFIGLFEAYIITELIDQISNNNKEIILTTLISFMAVIIANGVFVYISKICVSKLAAQVGYDLKTRVAKVLLCTKFQKLQKQESGNMLKTVNEDTANVCSFIGGDLIDIFSQVIMAFGALIYIVSIDKFLAIVTFLYTPLGIFFTLSINKKMNALYPISADYEGGSIVCSRADFMFNSCY